MKVDRMRRIDREVGRPIAYFLSLFTKSRDELPGKDIHSIVVSKYFGVGSITLSTPLLQSLREKFPDSKIVFATFEQNAELLKLFPFIDEIVTIRNNRLADFVVDTLKTLLYFRLKTKPDLFIDMEFFSHYSSLVAWLSGSKFRVGFHTSLLPRGKILTHRVAFNPHRHITEAFSALGQRIGAYRRYSLFEPPINESYMREVLEWLRKRGIRERMYVVISSQSSDHLGELKKWQVDKWAGLVMRIVESLKLPVILTGLKEDYEDIEGIINSLSYDVGKSVYNTAGAFSLGEFLALLATCRFLITIDSGPLHLSQSLGVPCVALFGPETPVLYGPRKKFDRTIYMDLYCSPCCNVLEGKKAECINPFYKECMRGMEVDRVWREVADLNKCLLDEGCNTTPRR